MLLILLRPFFPEKENLAFYRVELVLDFGILSCYARGHRENSQPRFFGIPACIIQTYCGRVMAVVFNL